MQSNVDNKRDVESLLYNVSRLLRSEIGQSRAYEFASDVPINLEDGLAVDVHGHVKFTQTNFGILGSGHAEATLLLTCARCLEPCQLPASIDFEEEYQPVIDITTGLPSSAPRSDAAFIITQSHTIDLTESIRQNLLVAMEMIPLCNPNCKGLCPECGVNRNLESCHCHDDMSASPFAVLEELFRESRES